MGFAKLIRRIITHYVLSSDYYEDKQKLKFTPAEGDMPLGQAFCRRER